MSVFDNIKCLRVRQWTKNSLLFAALIFSTHAQQAGFVVKTALAFLVFSLATGAVYIVNDLMDIDRDREHPLKKNRPIASGAVSVAMAWLQFFVIILLTVPSAFIIDREFGIVLLIYLVMQVCYSVYLKNVVILDVFIIGFGFILRVIAGAVVIDVEISNWILVCTMLLALFLALSKRRHEITLLDDKAYTHRIILREYTPYLLDQMISIVTSATLVAYMIFTLSQETIHKFGKNMVLTVPFVLYGIFRYLYLVHRKNAGGRPEEILLTDLPLQLAVFGWVVVLVLVIYL
jgi:4-hydroxybenzoate polyprenyltransferase